MLTLMLCLVEEAAAFYYLSMGRNSTVSGIRRLEKPCRRKRNRRVRCKE